MEISIVIVSYNAKESVACLASIRSHPPAASHGIIVVDNCPPMAAPTPRLASRASASFASSGTSGSLPATTPGYASARARIFFCSTAAIVPPNAIDSLWIDCDANLMWP